MLTEKRILFAQAVAMPDYGREHKALRAYLIARYIPGVTLCWRCGKPITTLRLRDIHLGHDDDNPLIWRGLEHAACNLAAGGVKSGWADPAMRQARARRRHTRLSRIW